MPSLTEPKISQPKTVIPDYDIDAKGARLALGRKTYVMGVLNITPDSFSEKGEFFDRAKAIGHAFKMARDGADIIDIGGESTRPGAGDISVDEELSRVIPVIEAIAGSINIPISIDTRKSKVAEAAIEKGASIINDISGLNHDRDMGLIAAKYGVGLIVMHMKGMPKDMQAKAAYKNLIKEIIDSLKESMDIGKRAGVRETRMIVDPGIGFGKTAEHNLEILNRLGEFKALGRPICVGTSRKSFIGKVLGLDDPKERLAGTLATLAIAVIKGANILRVHDVKEAVQVARIADSVTRESIT